MSFTIAIMSRGRAKSQETLKWIPKRFQYAVVIVCSQGERSEYEKHNIFVPIIEAPATVTNYSQKMQWIMDTYHSGRVVICDDDLYFSQYQECDGSRKLVVIKDAEQLIPMWDQMDRMLEKIPLVGVHPRVMAQNAKPPFEWNSKIVTIQGVNLDIIKENLGNLPRIDRFPILSDVLLNCILLSHGMPNARITTYFVDWLPSQAPGGCSLYRTADMQEMACRAIAEKYGPFAKLVEKRPKTAKWLGDVRYDLKIQWKGLYNSSFNRSKKPVDILDKRAVQNLPE